MLSEKFLGRDGDGFSVTPTVLTLSPSMLSLPSQFWGNEILMQLVLFVYMPLIGIGKWKWLEYQRTIHY